MHLTRDRAGARDRASASTDPAGEGDKAPGRDPALGIVLAVVAATLLWPILIGLYIYFFH